MTELRFTQVDAFADRPFTGNPAAVIPLDAWLPDVVGALGCEAQETLWQAEGNALIVVASEAELLAVAPDFRALAAFGDILTIVTAPGSQTDVASRVFAVGAGIDEDPVTGSAH